MQLSQLTTTKMIVFFAAQDVIKDNLRVNRALKEHGIEIPYNYLNVVQKQEEEK